MRKKVYARRDTGRGQDSRPGIFGRVTRVNCPSEAEVLKHISLSCARKTTREKGCDRRSSSCPRPGVGCRQGEESCFGPESLVSRLK